MKAGLTLVLESDIGADFAGLVYREIQEGASPSQFGYSAYWKADNENPALAAIPQGANLYHSPRLTK
ncbi:hypothetical protein [Bradyrhizobium sp. Ec3.3]|uniref:hypothetical protein n=1 Tax=Bradyrhizobium sp. Ec3.3 TaxID=189753 RepID=UPI000484AA6D|nr:hypothetical protein [Bradyrhizobium sp. Ec3.3]